MNISFEDNPEAQKAIKRFKNKESFFLTGKAGSGKSELIRQLYAFKPKKTVLLAPTGLSALHIGGMTLHSFFGLPIRPFMPSDPRLPNVHPVKQKAIQNAEVIIIDEVSMVRADVLDAIDCVLRKYSRSPDFPFGGKQIVFVGDLYQLEPVVPYNTEESSVLKMHYKLPPYIFESHGYKEIQPSLIELQKLYRQSDPNFIQILNNIRIGDVEEWDLKTLNEAVRPYSPGTGKGVYLCSQNSRADAINLENLKKLSGKAQLLPAKIEGTFDASRYPTDGILTLKEQARVMFIRNDQQGRWVNGTMGTVSKLTADALYVQIDQGEEVEVAPHVFENVSFQYNTKENCIETKVLGSFTQFPLRLAWAISIHKSQGLTFDHIHMDLNRGAFAAGQLYVALSRCRTMEGLSLQNPIRYQDIIVHPSVQNYLSRAPKG